MCRESSDRKGGATTALSELELIEEEVKGCKQLNAIYRFRRAEREKGGREKHGRAAENRKLYTQLTRVHSGKKRRREKKKCCFDWNRSWQCCAHRLVPLAASHLKKIQPSVLLLNPELQNLALFCSLPLHRVSFMTFNRAEMYLK